MKKTSLVLVALATVIASLGASASASAPSNRLVVRGLVRGDLGTAQKGPRKAARIALRKAAPRLGVDPSAFRFDSVERSLVGTHVRAAQYADGLKVEGGNAIVSIVDGRVVWVQARQVRAPALVAPVVVGSTAARATALGRLGVTSPERTSVERLLVLRGGELIDTYRVTVLSLAPAVAATVDVSAADGSVLSVSDHNRYDDAVATVFDPNPIVTMKDASLREPGLDSGAGPDLDLDDPKLTAALVDLPILEYDGRQALLGRLVGPWATVQGQAPMVQLTPGRFDYTRADVRFEALMAYAHLDGYQRYLQQRLGFTGQASINAESQDVYALRVEGFDNSFYQPGNDLMLFGAGGVDDGEDAEVILHEYGHAVQDDQVPGWGETSEGGAMGEGFGDFQAGAYYARISYGFQDVCVMDWDATSYSADDPTCLRRMDSPKHYPENIEDEVHADGEIWATFLWNVRDGLVDSAEAQSMNRTQLAEAKSDRSLRLVLTSHEFLTPTANFRDGVLALLTAADALGHPEWVSVIKAKATAIGLSTQ